MSRSDIVEEINEIDCKIAKAEKMVQEKRLKIERLIQKKSKLLSILDTKPLSAEGLLERFVENMAVAKGKSGQSSQTPSTPEEQVVLQPRILDQGIQKIEEAYKASEPFKAIASQKCKPYAYQGYKTYELARKAFYDYCVKHNTPLQSVPKLITPTDVLQPQIPKVPTFADKAKMPANPVLNRAFTRFNKLRVPDVDDHDFISLETFDHYYTLAESTTIDEQNHYFISKTRNLRIYNVTIGASPKLVQTLYYCGLLNTICPSSNLKEISLLPQKILTAVKQYRQKVLQDPERRVYLSFKSSFLDWEDTEDETDSLRNYPAYHYIKMGMFRGQDVRPCTESTTDLHTVLPKLRHLLISNEDCAKIQEFEHQFYCNDLKASIATKKKLCAYGSKDHKCDFCFKEEDEKMETASSNNDDAHSDDSCQPGKPRIADEM
ncbi:hypothetical protein POTOM_032112 [Populus tomentosa]|uniref:Uncharacterized protein n=1 Tax=Populus tomentosa TaxID=118781 RepID=A0A8X7Z3R4_POPTO|nr:hypothetical protein POTOM_032111 [Populus tomentosa]KAG6764633.1 hypothetical protein POTOM_032112 [Populus tomentosa]